MNIISVLTAALLVAGQTGAGSWPWFMKNAEVVENRARAGKKKDAFDLIGEMQKEAAGQKDDLKILFVEWKKGVCEYYLGDYNQSIKTLESIENNPKNQPFRHALRRDLADSHLGAGNFDKADAALQKALKENSSLKPADQFVEPEVISIKLKQIRCRMGLEDFKEAQTRLTSLAKEINIDKRPKAPEWACLDARWNLLQAGVDLERRRTLRALQRREAAHKSLEAFPKYPEAIDLRFNGLIDQAGVYLLVAQFAQADAQLDAAEKMLKLVESQPRNVAGLRNARAAVLIEKATLAIEDEPAAPDVLRSLDQARANLDQAQKLLDNAGGDGGLLAAAVDFQHALVHELRGRALEVRQKKDDATEEFKAGIKACEKALQTRGRTLPAHHVIVLETRTLHAWLNLRLGSADAAQKEAKDALKRYDEMHPKNDIDRGRFLHVLFEAENRAGNKEAARKYADEHRHLVDEGLSGLLAGLSAPEQIQFFRKWDNRALHASLRLSIQNPNDVATSESAVEWLINGKTRLTDVLAAQIRTAKSGDRTSFASFQKSVQRQAYLLYGETNISPVALQNEYLREEIHKHDYVEKASAKYPMQLRWYTLAEVRKSLSADEVYIGVFALRAEESGARAYYAWIVGAQGKVQIVPLGDADRIDSLVKVFQREQEKAPYIAPGQERKAEQDLRDKCLTELSVRILQPIRQRAGGHKRWVVSPDGPLWNLPWAALVLPETDRYAIEELTFRYAISGRDLVRERQPATNVTGPLILGDPWFNYPSNDPVHLRRQGLDPLRIPWDRLEYSRRECDTVYMVMNELKLQPLRSLSTMRKEQLLDMQSVPSMVYLSTHAFAPLPSKAAVHDPLLSCALAFAGWNYLPPGRDELPGMMTGAELLGVDLRGTELVVLASCEAGTDPLVAGQSPANLRHAFHLAGAQAVVSALWTIQDRSSLELMEPFVAKASLPNSDKVAALQSAQQQSIRYLRLYRDHTHPFYWAGFTISGG